MLNLCVALGTYDASVLMDTNDDDAKDTDRQPITVGMDAGVKELAVLSNGEWFPAHQQPKANIHRLKRRGRRFSRKQNGSHRATKAKLSLARLHKGIADQRHAVLHE